jgi:hypothetical protein
MDIPASLTVHQGIAPQPRAAINRSQPAHDVHREAYRHVSDGETVVCWSGITAVAANGAIARQRNFRR